MIEKYGTERLMANSAGDWGPSKPTAVPDLIMVMRKRGVSEAKIRKIVYDNPLSFFAKSSNFKFQPRE
jgi:predicted metal-dependent TIM-barrel fold hydrolase